MAVPETRLRVVSEAPARAQGRWVLYWMAWQRRLGWNFALQRAVEWAQELAKPLLVAEELRCGRRWDSDRLHRFALEGMAEHRRRFPRTRATYYPYLEPRPGEADRLLAALADLACVVILDDFPLREANAALAQTDWSVRAEAVDSNGLLPMRLGEQVFPTAYAFRRFLQRELPSHLLAFPAPNPLARAKLPPPEAVPQKIAARWPALPENPDLSSLPIDHSISPVALRGGTAAAEQTLLTFLAARLERYLEDRNEPEREGTSGLSPYLHFGHISAHQVFAELASREGWDPARLSAATSGRRVGWWGMSAPAEAFLDQLITWREVGYNFCLHRDDYDQYQSLPDWARETLEAHAADPRPTLYSREELETARTHDPLWNAAQRQLMREGRLHNYLRMLWGKKILEWTPHPREALEVMIELNNRYALDGRNPNSYSGICWVLGRYDRPWGPRRPIFGTVRYMSSENTARKVQVREFVRRYGS